MKNNKNRPWTQFYPLNVKDKLVYPNNTMVGYLLEAVARYPEYIAYEYYGTTVTYRAFYEKIRDTAKSLRAQGVRENDTVSICMPNTPEALMMFYAVNMIGAVSSMIHPLSGERGIFDFNCIQKCGIHEGIFSLCVRTQADRERSDQNNQGTAYREAGAGRADAGAGDTAFGAAVTKHSQRHP